MRLSEFDYDLPRGLIAQRPALARDRARLMVVDRKSRSIDSTKFSRIARYFNAGDLLVVNDTRVIPARLRGRRKTGGKVEIFLLEAGTDVCEALVKPSGRLPEGETVVLESGDEAEVLGRGPTGRFVRFSRPAQDIMRACGHTPLPPYIRRADEPADAEAYQTVYARREGATAAPTAGLHFTDGLLQEIEAKGVGVVSVTLHTSYGTFAPVTTDRVEDHRMHRESFECTAEAAAAVGERKARGSSVFAVGTTSARVLEHCASEEVTRSPACPHESFEQAGRPRHPPAGTSPSSRRAGQVTGKRGSTNLFIYPPYEFKVVDHLITNFHLPKSTLLLLVSAFAGRDLIFEAYRRAIEEGYRFFSYGDAMLIL